MMQFQQSVTIVPERWEAWAQRCRQQAPASQKWFVSVIAMYEENTARWIEDGYAPRGR